MPSSPKPRSVRVAGRRALVTTTVLGLLAAPLALSGPASANPAGSNLVISEVYGAGANPGAVYNADYVELFNPTASDIGLSGLSVQSRFGGVTTPLPLTGTVAAGEHFLIQMTAAGAVGADLPSPDQVAASDVEMGGAAGQVFLVIGTTAFLTTGNVAGDAQLVDMVGYGNTGTFETANTGVQLGAAWAATRDALGADTDNNLNDFTRIAPDPQHGPPPPPVGQLTADLTRAFSNGSFVSGTWEVPLPRAEDLSSESTLGDAVANALRDGVAADLGVVNPGDLHADLLYAGDTSSDLANLDGVITHAEANAVLPIGENVWSVDLTGAQLEAVLEQQWQVDPVGQGPSDQLLHLGLSDNVQTTLDPTRPDGSHVTSVTIDDQPIDPAAIYTVSTLSTLAAGGDPFPAFGEGTAHNSGLVGRDALITYLANAPASPDFVRQQVYQTGMPDTVYAGEHVAFTLDKLNLSSLGSPENTSVEMSALDATSEQSLGTVPVTGGTAAVALDVPASFAGGGTLTLTAQPSGTTVEIPITAKDTPVVKIKKSPKVVHRNVTRAVLDVSVTAPGVTPAGSVKILVDGKLFKTKSLSDGALPVKLAVFKTTGVHAVKVVYTGGLTLTRAVATRDIKVVK